MYYSSLSCRGARSLSGTNWIRFAYEDRVAWLRERECVGSGSGPLELLADRGLPIVGKDAGSQIVERAAKVCRFPDEPLLDQVGWNGQHFALPDGTSFGIGEKSVVFDQWHGKCATSGSLNAWKKLVASRVAGQALPSFVLMFAFMPPLLKIARRLDNFGFELVGAPGTGKSSLQRLGASVWGGIGLGGRDDYAVTFDTTLNGLEAQMAVHADLPMFIEEANLFLAGEPPARRAQAFRALAFRMSGGREKARFAGPTPRDFRFAYLTSSNEPLASMLNQNSYVAKAAGDRLITLSIDSGRPYGVFDSLPQDCGSASEFVASLVKSASAHHGKAGRRFLRGLVDARHGGEAALSAAIETRLVQFRKRAQVDLNDGSAVRVVDTFGLIFAAGVLAKKFGALPADFPCGPPILDSYRMYVSSRTQPLALLEQLEDIAGGPTTVPFGSDASTVRKAQAVLKVTPRGRSLLIRSEAVEALLPDWTRLKRQPELRQYLRSEEGRLTIKRGVTRDGKTERVYCFELGKKAEQADAAP